MIYRQTQLYKFLEYCNKSNMEKENIGLGSRRKYAATRVIL